ncbi:MAG: geranylgeranylglycerol-phosphate geranylgeranyltransferase [Candidatus Zixiibacteriota bacterium]
MSTRTSSPMDSVLAWWRLARGNNALLAGAASWIGAYLATGRWLHSALPGAILAPILIAAAGNIDNDLHDRPIDTLNGLDRPLVTGAISVGAARIVRIALLLLGLGAACACGWRSALIAMTVVVVLVLYNRRLSGIPVFGNVAVALTGSASIVYGAVCTVPTDPSDWIAPGWGALAAFWLHLPREILKDALDVAGDAVSGRRTLATAYGRAPAIRVAALLMSVAAVIVLIIGLGPWFGPLYLFGVIVTIIPALLLGAAQCWFNPSEDGASRWSAGLKLCMLAGLAWLALGRLNP